MYERFEALLKENNISIYKVCEETGIAKTTLYDWKYGRSTPKIDKLIKLSKFFDVPIEYFLSE